MGIQLTVSPSSWIDEGKDEVLDFAFHAEKIQQIKSSAFNKGNTYIMHFGQQHIAFLIEQDKFSNRLDISSDEVSIAVDALNISIADSYISFSVNVSRFDASEFIAELKKLVYECDFYNEL